MHEGVQQVLDRAQGRRGFRSLQQALTQEQRAKDIIRLGRATHWRCEKCSTTTPLGEIPCSCRSVLVTGLSGPKGELDIGY